MSAAELAKFPAELAQFSVEGSAPVSGKKYRVKNYAHGHVLHNAKATVTDGNPVLAWSLASTDFNNQLWQYLEYPATNGDVIFTLQVVSTVQDNIAIDGRGGYLSVDPKTNKLIQMGTPFPWKRLDITSNVYRFTPASSLYSNDGQLVATDVNPTITSEEANQAALTAADSLAPGPQFWTFI